MEIIYDMPEVRGILQKNVNLGKRSYLGCGGNADFLFIPEDMDDLVFFLRNISPDINIVVLGAMSNVLIRSGGIRGVVIILDQWFKKIFIEDNIVEVGAALCCSDLSNAAMDAEVGGFEFLIGFPGTIGGAIRMNAGCYGGNISDVLVEFEAVTKSGMVKWINARDINFAYRKSDISDDLIITRAWLKGMADVRYSVSKKTNEIMKRRRESQPSQKKSCGSTFKNPKDGEKKAWELIESAGCRGIKIGGAMVSEKHCNFLVNENDATPEEFEKLGELVQQKVFDNSGILLEWEVIRLGDSVF
ncbi:MAG: UDP-N-acetylmuramate dehydrogenase [Holosporaceae bacterium]|jgi:UDP-N-acetylmuramate dehydrogenase|nr:UDP-N-acetylmuramate dehydrogenase [Holosporaceae bacterium]